MCNIPIELNGDVFATYCGAYGGVEEVLPTRSVARKAHGDCINMCLNREGFQAIPHIIAYEEQNMIVVVEDRGPFCWACKQIDHFARSCPQMTSKPTTITTAAVTSATSPSKPGLEPGDHPDREGWTQVIHKGRKKPS